MFGSIDATMIRAITPEILVVVLGAIVLVLDLIISDKGKRNLGWVTAVGLGIIMIVTFVVAPSGDGELLWGGMIRYDMTSFLFMELFLFGAAITALFAMDFSSISRRGEFYILMLASITGMLLLAAAADLIMVYVAFETVSIPMYILAGFFTRESKSTEAGFKYFLFGAMASAIMVYGLSLLYGFSGTTNIYELARQFQANGIETGLLVGSLLLILVGFLFKISAVPMHFWAPDTYQGSPTPVAGLLSTASKAAGFAVLIRVLIVAFPEIQVQWGAIVAAISVAAMTLGNLTAIAQKDIKRLLAYSSIAHAGYALIGIAAVSASGISSTMFYLIAYLVTNLAAFGIVAAIWRIIKSDKIEDYAGLSRRSPWLALALMIALFSLAGMPPFAGFITKVLVFAAAVEAGLIWLAVIGVLNAIFGLYYYLIVLKVVYLYRSDKEDQKIPVTRPYAVALVILTAGIILIGTIFAPWFSWATTAASSMF
jgi:NADH-quinone oxidoreductase subunit N